MAKKTKKKSKKRSKFGLFVISVVVVAAVAFIGYLVTEQPTTGDVAAIVNGEVITQDELDQKYGNLPEQYRILVTQEDLLDQLINAKLLIQEANAKGIEISIISIDDLIKLKKIADRKRDEMDIEALERVKEIKNGLK